VKTFTLIATSINGWMYTSRGLNVIAVAQGLKDAQVQMTQQKTMRGTTRLVIDSQRLGTEEVVSNEQAKLRSSDA
jgi:hypothetical protein